MGIPEPRDSSCRLYAGVPASHEGATLVPYSIPGSIPSCRLSAGEMFSSEDTTLVPSTGIFYPRG